MSVQSMPAALPGERPFSLIEQMQRISASACVDYKDKKNMCSSMIHVGIFFDCTNNNKKRDQENVKDPNKRSHSNVVVLHDAFKDAPDEGYYRFYVPGGAGAVLATFAVTGPTGITGALDTAIGKVTALLPH